MKLTYKERIGHERVRKANGSRHRDRRCAEAVVRNAARKGRTTDEQLALTDTRPGASYKERVRLITQAIGSEE